MHLLFSETKTEIQEILIKRKHDGNMKIRTKIQFESSDQFVVMYVLWGHICHLCVLVEYKFDLRRVFGA